MTVQVQPTLVRDPSVWTSTQQQEKRHEWCYNLTADDIAEIDAALDKVKESARELTVCATVNGLKLKRTVCGF